jgi:hypothetical protein
MDLEKIIKKISRFTVLAPKRVRHKQMRKKIKEQLKKLIRIKRGDHLMKESKNIHTVWWYDQRSSEKSLAGTALYNESKGTYSLRLNFFPDNKYEVETVGALDNISHFRVLAHKTNKDGKIIQTFNQGTGVLDEISGDIIIKSNPFTKLILISGKEKYEKYSA